MDRKSKEFTILNSVLPVAITSSTNANPSVITATAHGLLTNDRVYIAGHTTNTAINGIFKVVKITADTFSLVDEYTGVAIAGNGVGGATGFCMKAPVVALTRDYKVLKITVITESTATTTMKLAVSDGCLEDDAVTPRFQNPNFGAPITKLNPYYFSQMVDYDNGSAINGSTGIVVAGTDINEMYEANSNGIKFATILPVTWSAGKITVKMVGFSGY